MNKIALLLLCISNLSIAEVNVYTSRQEHLFKPVAKVFEKETGIKINFLVDKSLPLIKKIQSEKNQPKADLLITVDAGNLWYAKNQGIFEAYQSKTLQQNIPSHLRDSQHHWFGLSVRARTIVYSKERVQPALLSTYENLGDKKWLKKLCLRTSKKIYNKSLVAMMIADSGENATEKVVKSWMKNLATNPFSNDTRLIKAIAAGQCDVGIVNTYYLGRLLKEKPNFPVGIFWPNQKTNGVHVNISGGGIIKGANNRVEARTFLDWLSSAKAQKLFAELNLEFPANSSIPKDPIVDQWGPFKANPANIEKAGAYQAKAVMLMDRAGYN